jgi:sporulation protein YlmC with PRC-barrel domain
MKKQLLRISAFSVACLALGAQAQTSSDQSSGWEGHHLSPIGRMAHQEVRATRLAGAEVKSASGDNLGTINDVILSPSSGKVDFAVLSLSSAAGGSSSTASSSTEGSSATGSASSAGSGQLVAVPWALLRPANLSANNPSDGTGAASSAQPSFVYTGNVNKLQNAPTFSESNWPDISQPSWRHSIYAHFGMSPGTATGGASTPGGTGSSSSGSSGSDTGNPPQPPGSSENQ